MGLKSGSRDAGLDEDKESEERDQTEQNSERVATDQDDTRRDDDRVVSSANESSSKSEPASSGPQSQTTDSRPSMSSIPYKLRREKVNEGREQVPYFLRSEVIEGEDDLQDALEEILGEHVYKSDYREAAMIVAQRNPGLVAEVLREWGYDLQES